MDGFIGNKITENSVKLKNVSDASSQNFEELIIPQEKKREILSK